MITGLYDPAAIAYDGPAQRLLIADRSDNFTARITTFSTRRMRPMVAPPVASRTGMEEDAIGQVVGLVGEAAKKNLVAVILMGKVPEPVRRAALYLCGRGLINLSVWPEHRQAYDEWKKQPRTGFLSLKVFTDDTAAMQTSPLWAELQQESPAGALFLYEYPPMASEDPWGFLERLFVQEFKVSAEAFAEVRNRFVEELSRAVGLEENY